MRKAVGSLAPWLVAAAAGCLVLMGQGGAAERRLLTTEVADYFGLDQPAGAPPEIAFPPDGARVELGLGRDNAASLALKVRSGTPPFTWFADGAPVARSEFGHDAFWQPEGRGFVEVLVLDASRRAARARVFLDQAVGHRPSALGG